MLITVGLCARFFKQCTTACMEYHNIVIKFVVKCSKFNGGWGTDPDPAGSYDAPQTLSLAREWVNSSLP